MDIDTADIDFGIGMADIDSDKREYMDKVVLDN